MTSLTFGSLFAGIGGFDLGFERAGMRCSWTVEIDDRCNEVRAHHWLGVRQYKDVKDVGRNNLKSVDVICGGFPCQDISKANPLGQGLAGNRSGLWSEFARVICEIEPRWVVVENVRRLLSINDGRDFGAILADLARFGLDATWQVLRASDVGAPHRRERIFIVANRDGERIKRFWQKPFYWVNEFSWCQDVRGVKDLRDRPDIPQPLVRGVGNGVSFRVDAIGNAVVPQIAEWIGQRIIELDDHSSNLCSGLDLSQLNNSQDSRISEAVTIGT